MAIRTDEIQIDRKSFEGEVHDVMGGAGRWEVKVHDHGLVALVDVMPRFAPAGKTADFAIVQAARVSYGEGTKLVNEDRGLIYGHHPPRFDIDEAALPLGVELFARVVERFLAA